MGPGTAVSTKFISTNSGCSPILCYKKQVVKLHHSLQLLLRITDRENKTLEIISRGIYRNIYLFLLKYIE